MTPIERVLKRGGLRVWHQHSALHIELAFVAVSAFSGVQEVSQKLPSILWLHGILILTPSSHLGVGWTWQLGFSRTGTVRQSDGISLLGLSYTKIGVSVLSIFSLACPVLSCSSKGLCGIEGRLWASWVRWLTCIPLWDMSHDQQLDVMLSDPHPEAATFLTHRNWNNTGFKLIGRVR